MGQRLGVQFGDLADIGYRDRTDGPFGGLGLEAAQGLRQSQIRPELGQGFPAD
jgi:hypothetical protein